MLLKTFGWSFAITALGLALAGVLWGWQGLAIVGILSILEISLSFDNAVINAGILRKMNAFWQKIFLTVGILIAVFGMRLVFPVVIVAITAKLGPIEAVNLAINDKAQYEELVTERPPGHRGLRRDVPADDLPRLHLRGARLQVAVAGSRSPWPSSASSTRCRSSSRWSSCW